MDWIEWHRGYERWPPLQARLEAVRAQLASALSACPAGHIQIISLCAGDGRDLIGALAHHPRREDVSATLVETDAELITRGEAAVSHFNLSSYVRCLRADATLADTYRAIAPAQIVLAVGVFGNVRAADEGQLVQSLQRLCRPGGSVIWTRSVVKQDGERAAERIRQRLKEAGFHEHTLTRTTPHGFAIGTHTYRGEMQRLVPGTKLFEFTGYDRIADT